MLIAWIYLPPLSGVCLVMFCPDCKLWEEALAHTPVSLMENTE